MPLQQQQQSDAVPGLAWIDSVSSVQSDVLRGRFDTRARGSWNGVTVFEGTAEAYERPEGYFPWHVLTVNRGKLVPFEARLPGRLAYSGMSRPDEVNVWPAGMPHAIRWLHPGTWCVIQIAPAFVGAVAASLQIDRTPELRPSLGVRDRVVAHLAAGLALELREEGMEARLVRETLGTALVGHLLHAHTDAATHGRRAPKAQASGLGPTRLRRVLDYIEARLEGHVSLAELATVAGMNAFRFLRAFKLATGQPPHRYLLRARVDRAKSLLDHPGLSISEVALRTGFASASHFAATFHRITGSTPRSWRGGWQGR
jgi:AraC family transcriptional regulator